MRQVFCCLRLHSQLLVARTGVKPFNPMGLGGLVGFPTNTYQ